MKGFGRWIATLVGTAAIAVGLAACGSSSGSGDGDTTLLRLGYVTTAQHPYGIAVDLFAKEVEEASGGKITIETVPTASNKNDITLLEDVSGGTYEMGAISTAVWDGKGVEVFQPLQAPFVVTNYEMLAEITGGEIGQAMLDHPAGPSKLGLHGLGILEGGLRYPLAIDEPLTTPRAFVGKKLRAPPSKVMTAGYEALGAEPVAVPFTDVYPALANGTVDGMDANFGLIVTEKYYEVAKNFSYDLPMWPFPAAVVINQSVWDGLSDEQQQILTDAGKNIAENSKNIFLNPPADGPNFVQTLCDEGVVFAAVSDASRAALQKKAQPAIDALLNDPDTKDLMTQVLELEKTLGGAPTSELPAGCKTT